MGHDDDGRNASAIAETTSASSLCRRMLAADSLVLLDRNLLRVPRASAVARPTLAVRHLLDLAALARDRDRRPVHEAIVGGARRARARRVLRSARICRGRPALGGAANEEAVCGPRSIEERQLLKSLRWYDGFVIVWPIPAS